MSTNAMLRKTVLQEIAVLLVIERNRILTDRDVESYVCILIFVRVKKQRQATLIHIIQRSYGDDKRISNGPTFGINGNKGNMPYVTHTTAKGGYQEQKPP